MPLPRYHYSIVKSRANPAQIRILSLLILRANFYRYLGCTQRILDRCIVTPIGRKSMARKTWTAKRLSVSFTKEEVELLEQYCEKTGRTTTDVIRERVRGLKRELKKLQTGEI